MNNFFQIRDSKLDIQGLSTWKDELFLFLWGSMGFQLVAVPWSFVALATGWREDQMSMMVNLLAYATIFVGFVIYLFLARPGLGRIILSSFKHNGKRTARGFVETYVVYMVLVLIYTLVKTLCNVETSDNANQSSLESMKIFAVALITMTVLLAPICEELTYRVGLCSLLKRGNPWLAVIGSGVIFGLIHFDFTSIATAMNGSGNEALVNELWNLPLYMFSGFAMGFSYVKEGCFTASWSYHFFNNLVAIVSMYV